MREDHQKALKKLISFLLSNPVPFNEQSYLERKGSGTSDQSLLRLQNKFKKIPLLLIYYLTKFDDILQSSFWVIPKITPGNLYKPIYNIIIYSIPFVLLSLKSVERGKNTKIWISQERTELSRWNKKHFSLILKGYHMIWWKNKNLIKNSRHKL